jgi:hypothetical protein
MNVKYILFTTSYFFFFLKEDLTFKDKLNSSPTIICEEQNKKKMRNIAD